MISEWGFRNVFKCDGGNACYTLYKRSDGMLEAVYHYASFAHAGVCDMTDYSQTVLARSWNELRRKLAQKHPTGWSWVTE